jgi:hypothetical protein
MTTETDRPGGTGADGPRGAGNTERLAGRSDPRIKPSSYKSQASPWAVSDDLKPPLQLHRLLSAGERSWVKVQIILPQWREVVAELRKTAPPTDCIGCSKVHRRDEGTFVMAYNLANKSHFATGWFCKRCAEMDNEALLDVACKTLQEDVYAALKGAPQ